MATFTVTTDTLYSALASPASNDIVSISNNAKFTVDTTTVDLQTIECLSLGEILLENTSSGSPIFVNMGNNASSSGAIRAQGGAKLTVRGDWISLGTSDGTASQTFNTPTDAGGQNYSRLGGVWVNGEWWCCVLSLTDWDSDDTGKVCVHNTTLNRIEFGDGTSGKIPANGATIQIPNIQIRYRDTANTARSINLDIYQTGTADIRICALDGYVAAPNSTTDFHANSSQFTWDRVCMDVGGSNNGNLRWTWDNPDADSSMTDVCFSRMLGSSREFQALSSSAKYTFNRVTYVALTSGNVLISGTNSKIIDFKFITPTTSQAPNITISGRKAYIKGFRLLARGGLIVSGTNSVLEDFRLSHRVTRTSTTAANATSLVLSGEGAILNGMTDWKTTNRMNNPIGGSGGFVSITGLGAKVFNVYDIGDTTASAGSMLRIIGRGAEINDASFNDNSVRGNVIVVSPQATVRNIFTTDTSTTTDGNALITIVNDAVYEFAMMNYKTTATRILNGVSTGSQGRYVSLTPNGVGSDIGDVLMLQNDLGRTYGMIITTFGQEKTREFYAPDPGNTGSILFTNDGKVWIPTSGDKFTLTGRKHFGITAWGDVLIDGTNSLNFTYEFRAKEGNGSFGTWYALTTANLTTATSGFSDMKNNGVTLEYRITHNASNYTDNVNLLEVRCTTDSTYVVDYVVSDVVSSSDYTLHRKLDMQDCIIDGTLTFAASGSYNLTDCFIDSVSNTSSGVVTINPIGTTEITNNLGPNITINIAATTFTISGLVSGTEVRAYTGTDPATAVEIAATDSSSTSFSFTNSYGGIDGYVVVRKLGYKFLKIPVTYPNTTSELPVQQVVDPWYQNP